MPNHKLPILTFTTFKSQHFSIKFPKHLRELKLTQKTGPIVNNKDIRRVRMTKILRSLTTTFPNDRLKKPLYSLICRLHRKNMRYLNTNGDNYYHIIQNPRRYDLQLGNRASWKTFFTKNSIRFLKIYSNMYDNALSEKYVAWALYRLQHSTKEFRSIREIEITGHVLNDVSETLIDSLTQTIEKQRSNMTIELKSFDHNSEDLIWLDTPIMKKYTTSVYFVNRCNNAVTISEPLESLPTFHDLQKLELWTRLHQKNDFSVFKQLALCRKMKELYLRIDFDGDLEKVSKKFLAHVKFPTSLTHLNLSISGLRLYWINQGIPRIKDLEDDPSTAIFLEEFEKLESLATFNFSLHDLRINFSSIFINVIRRLTNLKGLTVIMGLREFNFKDAPDYLILEFGFWCRKLGHIFNQIQTLSIEFPCIFLDEIESASGLLKNAEIISLGYRILSKEKQASSKVDAFLDTLNPNKITALFLGDTGSENEESLRKRFDTLAKLKSLHNLTIAVKVKSVNSQLFAHLCWSIARMYQLRRLSCRLEQAVMEDKEWDLKLKKTLVAMKYMDWASISCKSGKIEFER